MKRINQHWNRRLILGALTLTLAAGAALADTKETARAVFAKSKDAVIRVTAILKVEVAGRNSSSEDVEVSGTIIGDDGLAVVSASAINPVAAIVDAAGEERVSSKPKVELTQIKYRLADGTEVPARLVFKDKDLDLAYLVPDLKEGETAPKFTSLEVKEGQGALADNVAPDSYNNATSNTSNHDNNGTHQAEVEVKAKRGQKTPRASRPTTGTHGKEGGRQRVEVGRKEYVGRKKMETIRTRTLSTDFFLTCFKNLHL